MTTVDLLKAARAEIANGWCKNSLQDGAGNVCALGALKRAVQGDAHAVGPFNASPEGLAVYKALRPHLPESMQTIAEFNNATTTTKQDVLNWFDKALADLGGLA